MDVAKAQDKVASGKREERGAVVRKGRKCDGSRTEYVEREDKRERERRRDSK